MRQSRVVVAVILVALFMVVACGKGKSTEVNVPQYPGSVKDQAYSMGGIAKVERYFTTDSYEDVIAFYERELSEYSPEIQSFDLENSRQTKIGIINEEKRTASVVIQEIDEDDRVAIVFMGVSL